MYRERSNPQALLPKKGKVRYHEEDMKKGVENLVIWVLFLCISFGVTGYILWFIYEFRSGETNIQRTLVFSSQSMGHEARTVNETMD